MASNVYVVFSGPAFSFLIYENVKSLGDQEGFLLGEVVKHVTDSISDSDLRNERMDTIISVNSVMPVPSSFSYYNGIGRIESEKLKSFLRHKQKEVVGWYRFRRAATLAPHLRDRIIHKQLTNVLKHLPSENLAMCMLGESVSTTGSTHNFTHRCFQYRARCFEPLTSQIQNLGQSLNTEYQVTPSTVCVSESFSAIVSSLRSSHGGLSDTDLMLLIHRRLQEYLASLVKEVRKSEEQRAQLEKEVEALRKQTQPILDDLLSPKRLEGDQGGITCTTDTSATEVVISTSGAAAVCVSPPAVTLALFGRAGKKTAPVETVTKPCGVLPKTQARPSIYDPPAPSKASGMSVPVTCLSVEVPTSPEYKLVTAATTSKTVTVSTVSAAVGLEASAVSVTPESSNLVMTVVATPTVVSKTNNLSVERSPAPAPTASDPPNISQAAGEPCDYVPELMAQMSRQARGRRIPTRTDFPSLRSLNHSSPINASQSRGRGYAGAVKGLNPEKTDK